LEIEPALVAAEAEATPRQVVAYALWFWRPLRHTLMPVHYSWLIPLVAYLLAGGATAVLARGPARRFLTSLLVVNTMSSLLLLVFADKGIDQLGSGTYYICYFYWSAPAIMLLVTGLAVAQALPSAVGIPAVTMAALAGCLALAPDTNTLNVDKTAFDPTLPNAVSVLAARSAGKPIVIRLRHDAWAELDGFLVQAERSNVRACVADSSWTFMVTSQFICSPQEVASGAAYTFLPASQVPPGTPVLTRLGGVIVTTRTGLVTGPTG
jgi:hypothetical protein